jgi:hypothetical protein
LNTFGSVSLTLQSVKNMPRPRTDHMCVQIKICAPNDLNDVIERYQAELRSRKGIKVSKAEAASMLFEKLTKEGGLIA